MMETEQMSKSFENLSNEIKKCFTNFIQTFPNETGDRKYIKLIEKMTINSNHQIIIGLKDFLHYNSDLANIVFTQYYRYQSHLNQAFTSFMREYMRTQNMNDDSNSQDKDQIYEVTFDEGLSEGADSVRDLKSNLLGKLRSFRGTVTRTLEVRPELIVGVFRCKQCGSFSKDIPQQFKYTEPKKCSNANCDKRFWELDLSKSQFADFQKIRVQEDPNRIPPGGMPRSIDVILRNKNTEKGQPGDLCNFIGYLCVAPDISSMIKPGEKTQITSRTYQSRGNLMDIDGVTGIKGFRQLNYKMIFIATNIIVENSQFNPQIPKEEQEEQEEQNKNGMKKQFSQEKILSKIYSNLLQSEITQIIKMKNNPNLYQDMAQSLFSSIFGHRQIKEALLLQLFSGIHKVTQNKINIRGDINILIVGDPSTAKSQFLKSVNKFVPRSVYTNGKTTSAAGLTASVTRDQNGNVGIQAGALMLADNGICCIDQFDKMDIKDQVAIHEAMEQQTISIAKAGVYATLNARTSILAAANPIFGRYDKSRTLKHNINLSAPIMSRFDLFFVLCDESNDLTDEHLSQFIVDMHRGNEARHAPKIQQKHIKTYISVAKKIKPRFNHQAAALIKKKFMELRAKDKNNRDNSYRVTVRQLESMIRLSEAYARLKLDMTIREEHVKEAYRLLNTSILKLQKSPIQLIEDQGSEEIQNLNQNFASMNFIEQQRRKKKDQDKKSKALSISHQLFEQVKRNTLKLFKQEKERHLRDQTTQEIKLSQEDLCSYLISINYENGQMFNTEQSKQIKKIMNSIIKYMINDERILMIQQDNVEADKRILSIHINFVE